jgi:hypothetical protein
MITSGLLRFPIPAVQEPMVQKQGEDMRKVSPTGFRVFWQGKQHP